MSSVDRAFAVSDEDEASFAALDTAGVAALEGLTGSRRLVLAAELGLTEEGVSDDQILDAMVKHPILINRPIVETDKGVRLCRPQDKVREIL